MLKTLRIISTDIIHKLKESIWIVYIENEGILQRKGLRGESLARWIVPLYLNTSLSKFLLVTLKTLLSSSIEGLMGLWEEHLPSLFPLKGTRRNLDDPYSNGGGSLSHPTAHQMRDVAPNRWWERWTPWEGTLALEERGGSQKRITPDTLSHVLRWTIHI